MFRSGNMIIIGTQCCIFITDQSLNFKTAELLKLGLNYVDTIWHMLSLQGRLHHINDGANAPWKK